jgi:hypothetical protein
LLLLYTYLAAPEDGPRVFNAAAYRLHAAHPPNHFAENHRLYRVNAPEWTQKQKEAVAAFAKKFKPAWKPRRGRFSDWHYMALTRFDDPNSFHYNKPVIVLINGRSFSATDIFLG